MRFCTSWLLKIPQRKTQVEDGETTMLTGDLLLVSTEKKHIKPRLISLGSKRYLDFADSILQIVREGFSNEMPRLHMRHDQRSLRWDNRPQGDSGYCQNHA